MGKFLNNIIQLKKIQDDLYKNRKDQIIFLKPVSLEDENSKISGIEKDNENTIVIIARRFDEWVLYIIQT